MTGSNYAYGSTLDWINQHWAFPEYFRKLFYETHNLIPSFAFNLGAGQNIYNFSYYGLLNPLILMSYFFPFIDMAYYIIGMMICVVMATISLLYIWLRKRFDETTSFVGTFVFLFASPLIFHSHRHIMFVDYLPFTILCLFGIDKYFEKNKKSLLIISIFLTIMTSYLYSVGSIVACVVYGIYKYFEIKKFTNLRSLIIDGTKFTSNILIGILSAGVLLLPTAYALINGRGKTNFSTNISSLLTPGLNYDFFLYDRYSTGLTSILALALLNNALSGKKERTLTALIFALMFIFPIFVYLLCGTMYLEGKILIPFLPILVLLICNTLRDLQSRKYELKKLIIPFSILSFCTIYYFIQIDELYYAADFAVLISVLFAFYKTKKIAIILIPVAISSLFFCYIANSTDNLVEKARLKNLYKADQERILEKITTEDKSFYRSGNQIDESDNINRIFNAKQYQTAVYSSLSNRYFTNFFHNVSGNENYQRNNAATTTSSNILFNTYMGIKYIFTNKPSVGYEKIGTNTYVNNSVFSVGYATDSLMSNEEYNRLEYPYNMDALLNHIVVNRKIENVYLPKVKEQELTYKTKYKNLSISKINDTYNISAKENNNLTLTLDQPIDNKILLISLESLYSQPCSKGDTYITINRVKNKLTCSDWKYHNNNYLFTYSISSPKKISDLKITFGEGTYQIKNIKTYLLDYEDVKNITKTHDNFNIDREKTSGDKIFGEIEVKNDGYFTLSIPYDKGFTIKVDGRKVDYELVNTSFIGFEISKGHHDIEITYTAPYLNLGKLVSLIGLGLFGYITYNERRKKF